MASSLFWNRPPTRDLMRPADPLGFDALREAMADKLVPLLTGATRHADEYVWTLIGLRWARQVSDSSIDEMIFKQGFAPFERALKQYWYKFFRRRSSGINVIKEICARSQPDVHRQILLNQRATGLLGNYAVSLRAMGLVQQDSLRLVDDAADGVLADIKFAPSPGWTSSWAALKNTFSHVELGSARQHLGKRLFEGNIPEMTRAARSVRDNPSAASWAKVALHELEAEQKRIAKATTAVLGLENAALKALAILLRGERAFPKLLEESLRSFAAAAKQANPFPSNWDNKSLLRSVMGDALSSLARGGDPAAALLDLHTRVTREVRHTELWLRHLGDMPADFQRWQPSKARPDLRLGNLRNLVKQTKWRPHAN